MRYVSIHVSIVRPTDNVSTRKCLESGISGLCEVCRVGCVKWVGLCVGVMLVSCGFRACIAWVSFRCCLGFVWVSCGCCVGAIWVLCGSCVGVICPPPPRTISGLGVLH